jgi:hypothetical protein
MTRGSRRRGRVSRARNWVQHRGPIAGPALIYQHGLPVPNVTAGISHFNCECRLRVGGLLKSIDPSVVVEIRADEQTCWLRCVAAWSVEQRTKGEAWVWGVRAVPCERGRGRRWQDEEKWERGRVSEEKKREEWKKRLTLNQWDFS